MLSFYPAAAAHAFSVANIAELVSERAINKPTNG
jgi:hypothetical protein